MWVMGTGTCAATAHCIITMLSSWAPNGVKHGWKMIAWYLHCTGGERGEREGIFL